MEHRWAAQSQDRTSLDIGKDLSYGSLQAVHGNDLKSWSEENQSRNLELEYQLRFGYFIVMQKTNNWLSIAFLYPFSH